VSLQVEQLLCREEKQCVLSDRIIQNGPQNENQQIVKPFFSSLLELYFRPTFNDLQDEQRSQGTIRSQEN
jgi:hypothetical protein